MSSFDALGFSGPDWLQIWQVAWQLAVAAILGGILGLEREFRGHAAGLRTHMLVSLGSALFTIVPVVANPNSDLSEAVKGIAAGVGFLGAGAILKKTDEGDIKGLTTAASIWFTAATGLAVGAGRIAIAMLATIMAWLVLYALRVAQDRLDSAS
jgi:putative Mg2+ transporter-C (MgtC) family protein